MNDQNYVLRARGDALAQLTRAVAKLELARKERSLAETQAKFRGCSEEEIANAIARGHQTANTATPQHRINDKK